MSDLVTGEAVVLDIRVAKLATRALARVIDMAAQVLVLYTATYLFIQHLDTDSAAVTAIFLVVYVAIIVVYPTVAETLWRGKTLGKAAMGLRVVRDDGGPEQFRQALFRALTGVVEIWATSGFLAVLVSFVNHRGKRLGDVFTGTIVVAERVPGRRRWTVEMPTGAEQWARTLELTLLDDELALAARQYLTRYEDFTHATAERLGGRIAAQVSARVTPPPPPGLSPYLYLSAVLAERRRREALRMAPGR